MRFIRNEEEIDICDAAEKRIEYMQNCGVKTNSIVAICFEDSLEIILYWLACQTLNCVPLFLPSYFDSFTMDDIFNNIDVNYVIKDNQVIQITEEALFDKYNLKPHDIIHTTSATEGMPKIVVRTERAVVSEIQRYIKGIGADSNDVIMPLLPMYHSYGFLCGFMLAYNLDSTLILCNIKYPKKIIHCINTYKVTILLSVPQIFRMIVESNHAEMKTCLKHVISSSAHLNEILANDFYQKYHVPIKQLLGSTETGSLAFSTSENGMNVFDRVFDHVNFNINEDGVLSVESFQTIGNYISKKSRVVINENQFCMGETAEKSEHGYIKILGRNDRVLNFAGRKVSYQYLKKKIMKYSGIEEMKIVVTDNNDIAEIEYYILPKEEYDEKEFVYFMKDHIEIWLQPKRIRYVTNTGTWKN